MGDMRAEIVIASKDIREDMPFFEGFGFRLDAIWPADDPQVAVLSGHGLRLRLDVAADVPAGRVRILTDAPEDLPEGRLAPGGTVIEVAPLTQPLTLPETQHAFSVRRLKDGAPWVIGRAGMHYRDLVPDRLGGSIIASHIRIPDGGPVPDMVHYHTVGFQLIYCYRGWVDLVYEDQGPPFRLHAGCCVIQPPEIRHRVLYASDNIEVIEIGVPAEHVTTIDHQMTLPNERVDPERRFQGQKFVHHREEEAVWAPSAHPGFEVRDTGIAANTGDVAGVRVLRASTSGSGPVVHDGDIHFTFVLEGSLRLKAAGEAYALSAGDAFTLPPGLPALYADRSDDLELLEVSLPGSPTVTAA